MAAASSHAFKAATGHADAFLVGLRAADCDQEAFGRLKVLDVERYQLGAPEGTGEREPS